MFYLNVTSVNEILHVLKSVICLYSGLLKDGYNMISQALALFVRVCGILHEDACMCLRLLGRLSYLMGDYPDVSPYVSVPRYKFMACSWKEGIKYHGYALNLHVQGLNSQNVWN